MSKSTTQKIQSPVRLGKVSRYFLIIFLPPAIIIAVLFLFFYKLETKAILNEIETLEAHTVKDEKVVIVDDFKLIVSDLLYIVNQQDLQNIFDAGQSAYVMKHLARDYLVFSGEKRAYDQIRIIGRTGMEVIRVNFNRGMPNIVPDEQLQLKSHRYYFGETYRLDRGEIYVSPLDLNIEKQKIELPIKPMIRFGTPFFDGQGQKQGIVILNYLGEVLLKKFNRVAQNTHGEMILLNADGFWLKGTGPEDEWGFMYEDRKDRTFGRRSPDAWLRISKNDSGQFYNEEGLFTFATVFPLEEMYQSGIIPRNSPEPGRFYNWKIVSQVPRSIFESKPDELFRRILILYAFLIVLIAIGCWLLARSIVRHNLAHEELQQKRKLAALGEMSAYLAHEVRNPLTSIGLSYETLNESPDIRGEDRACLEQMGKGLERLFVMATDLLDYSRKDIMNTESCDPLLIVNNIIIEFEREMLERKIELIKSLPEKGLDVRMDRLKIQQVLINIIKNALQSMDDGGTLRISAWKGIGTFVIAVSDSGCGISKEEVDKIFLPFYTSGKKGGTGLGMPIVKHFVDLHGGEVSVVSRPGRGTRVTVTLPL